MCRNIAFMCEQPHLQHMKRLHHIIWLFWHLSGADRDMGFTIFQPEQALSGQKTHGHIRVLLLERDQQRRHPARQFHQGRDDQLARHCLPAPLDPARQLAELIVGGSGHTQQVFARLGCLVPARMTLKQFDGKPAFQRIDVADYGGMVHAQHLRRAADGPHTRHLIGRFDFVPVIHPQPLMPTPVHY